MTGDIKQHMGLLQRMRCATVSIQSIQYNAAAAQHRQQCNHKLYMDIAPPLPAR